LGRPLKRCYETVTGHWPKAWEDDADGLINVVFIFTVVFVLGLLWNVSNSMELRSSSEADSRSVGPDITHFLRIPKMHHLLDKIPPLNLTLSQLNPVHTLILCFVCLIPHGMRLLNVRNKESVEQRAKKQFL
jgi:hypothetical protein